MNKPDDKNMNHDPQTESQSQNQDLLHPRARKNIPHPCSPNHTNSNNNDNNNISQSSDNDIIMGIKFSEFDHQPNVAAIRRNTPIPGQYNLNLNALSSSNSSVSGSGTINSTDRPPVPSSKVPSIPLNRARQPSPTSSGQIPNIKMNIDFNKFDNSGSSIRLPTPRPGQTIGPGGIPDDEYYKLTNSYKNPEEEESGEPDTEDGDYDNVHIDANQIPTEEEENDIPNIVIDANNLNNNENNEDNLPDVKVDIDFSKFDNQYHTNRFATPRPDKENDDDAVSLGEEEEEAADTEPNEMENIRIDVPLEFNNPADDDNNNENADVSLNIDFSQFDVNSRPLTMSTPRPVVADEGIDLEEDEEEINKPKNEVKRPIPSINNNNNANNKPKRIPMLPKIPNIPGSLPSPKIPRKQPPIPINNISNINNNKSDDNNNNSDVKVDIDFKQFDGAERAIRMPTPRPAESTNDANEISLGEEEEEAFEDENEMANVVIAIPLEPVEDTNIEPENDPVTMNIDFAQFDGPATSNHLATPRPDKPNDEGISNEEEEEAADVDENEENEENATYNNTRKFTFTSPPVPKRTASTPSPSPTKSFRLSIPPSSDADNDFNTDTLTDNDDIQFYVPNENNLSTPRPGQSCVRAAFKDAERAASIDDNENDDGDFGDEAVVINASVPLVPQIDINNENTPNINDDLRPMRRSTPRPSHHKKVYEEELHSDSSDEENCNDQGAPISPSKTKPYRTKSMPPFKVKSAANYKLPLIPLNVLTNNQTEVIPETEMNVNTDSITDTTPKNGDAVVGCSSTPPNKKVVSSPPKSTHPSPSKIPLLNFGTLKDPNNKT